jgi:hypothetical protein
MKPRIYLDIDGVLNSTTSDKLATETLPEISSLIKKDLYKNKHLLHRLWSPTAVSNLKMIIKETNADVYIHSTWRHHFSLDELKSFFKFWNINKSCIKGLVPQYKLSSERYHDISWHIDGDRLFSRDSKPCSNYVIIDDYNMTNISDKFVNQIVTDSNIGLTEVQSKKAIKLLK